MATKIDIISGFLGAGKTTLIKKLLKEAYARRDDSQTLCRRAAHQGRGIRQPYR